MSDPTKPVNVMILDKEYVVACTESEREPLFASVEFLNTKMQELKDSGKIIGAERIAVMTALNITHEYLDYKQHIENDTSSLGTGIKRMHDKITDVLQSRQYLEVNNVN